MPESKELKRLMFKSVSKGGNPARYVFGIHDDGCVYVNQFIFTSGESDGDPLFTRGGKTLYRTSMGMKFSSLDEIHKAAVDCFNEHKIIPEGYELNENK